MSDKRSRSRRYDVSKMLTAQARMGWTNERLASIAGVHPATISRLMRGETQSIATVKTVANALGLTLSELVNMQESAA